MFDTSPKATGTGYPTTVAFLTVTLAFMPALMFFDNFGREAMALAIAGSFVCLGMAWRSWEKSSQPAMAFIEPHR